MTVIVKIAKNVGDPPRKLAEAELHFVDGPLEGTKLVGFAVWEDAPGKRNVTVPARQYKLSGEQRRFALLRPITDDAAMARVRAFILEAYAAWEATQ